MDGNNLAADAAARKLAERNDAMTWKAKVNRFFGGIKSGCAWLWNSTPAATRSSVFFAALCLAIGFLSVMTYWEVTNAGSGYSLIFAGWGGVAWMAGASIAGFYMWSHRQHKETEREKEELETGQALALQTQNAILADEIKRTIKKTKQRAQRWQIVTILCAIVTAFGVFSNLVSHASMDTARAVEIEQDRSEVRKEISRLKRDLAVMPKPDGIESAQETLSQYLAEATGWKMANLDADGACNADLMKRPRELCKLASDIRAELKDATDMQRTVDAKKLEIADAEARLNNLKPIAGAAHYQAMAKLVMSMPGAPAEWEEGSLANGIQIWGVLFLALAGLYVCAVGWDSLGEMMQSRAKKKTAALTVRKGP